MATKHHAVRSIEESIMCPSTAPSETSHILGIKRSSGIIEFFDPPLPLPKVAQSVISLDDLQNKLRLTGPCVRRSCGYWSGKCDLGTEMVVKKDLALQPCPIRPLCRWHIENGPSVCGSCQTVLWHSRPGASE